jgi:hypothetical protein
MLDLCCRKWHSDMSFSRYFGFLLSVSFHWCPKLIFHLSTVDVMQSYRRTVSSNKTQTYFRHTRTDEGILELGRTSNSASRNNVLYYIRKFKMFLRHVFPSFRVKHRAWENCLRLQCVGNNERTIGAEVKFNMEIYCKHICIFCKRICWKWSVWYMADARIFQVFWRVTSQKFWTVRKFVFI